ncbi:MAG: conserved rane protein of unknown function [Hyphomicrobiales bacterium]|nr:conserved rane protein of unknown function [Hyphomicrobiales bacterium]
MFARLEQGVGLLLTLVILLDVFLTVLYARMGASVIAGRVGRLVWAFFLVVSNTVRLPRGAALSFCGPSILVSLVVVWALGLTLGAALIMHSELGGAIRATSGETPTDFVTAMYAGGTSMALVGASDFTPHTSATRLLFLVNSLIGTSVISLTLTYLMQVYTALQRRNVLAMNIHLLSGCSGDAADLLARLGPRGQFNGGYTHLAQLAAGMTEAKEAHHFYPVLFYFRFDDAHHSVSRSALVALDLASLVQCALNEKEFGWLKNAGAVAQLAEASMMLVTALERTFLPDGLPDPDPDLEQQAEDCWRARYRAALRRLQSAGIQTAADETAGAEAYVASRRGWIGHIANLAPAMGYSLEEVDPATEGLGGKKVQNGVTPRRSPVAS